MSLGDRQHVYDLYAAGCRDMIRETFDSSLRMGRSAFEALGKHPFEAEQMTRAFEKLDRRFLREMAEVYDPEIAIHENPAYVERARRIMEEQNLEMEGGGRALEAMNARRWSPPTPQDVATEKARREDEG